MKSRSGNGNAGESFTTAVIEENPYLQRATDGQRQADEDAYNELFEPAEEDEEGSAIELADERKKARQRRRRVALAAVAVLLLASVVCAFAFYRRSSTRVEYGSTAKQSRVVPPALNTSTVTARDTRTEQAIEEAQRLAAGSGKTSPVASPTSVSPRSSTDPAAGKSNGDPETPFKVPTDFGGTVKTKPDPQDSRIKTDPSSLGDRDSGTATEKASGGETKTIRSQRSQESSLYTAERTDQKSEVRVSGNRQPNKGTGLASRPKTEAAVVLPSFGSMLPVRTIGGLYTLRTGALTRLELTRDMNGDGWSMKRGTILVGTSKGGDYDRAYVSIAGFIDPQSGKLVKLGGDVLGGDGGAGLKGKRRQLDGGWARVLGQVGTAALNVTGALIGGRGNGTVIISDGLRTRAVNPVTDEISGVIGGQMDQKQRRGFVEVEAGTPGYVMVTDLPAAIKGTDANPEVNEHTLAALTDVEAPRAATGLSERELAELIANGSPEEIRAAMPRMSPEMRKIAAAVLER
jgi:hypothetical protein